MKLSLNGEDVSQVVIGAFVLAVPISFSEEAWAAAESLPLTNLCLVIFLSISFISLFAYQSLFQASIRHRIPVFVFRIFFDYLMTGLIVGIVLLAINKLPLITEPLIALKRIVLISMPASMGAIVVDSLDKE
jgi:uncharacterized membrane protein